MAYKVGQISNSWGDNTNISPAIDNEKITLPEKAKFEMGKNYYIRFLVRKNGTDTTLKFYLKNSEQENDNYKQLIHSVIIPASGSTDTWLEDYFCFNPLVDTFDSIVFSFTNGVQPVIALVDMHSFESVLDIDNVIKIGVQAEPETVLNINDEEIHVGASGIYELKNINVTINSFNVISYCSTVDSEGEDIYDIDNISSCTADSINTGEPVEPEYILDYMYSE